MENNPIVVLEEKVSKLIEKVKLFEAENNTLKEEMEKLKREKNIVNERIDKLLGRLEEIG